MTLERLFVFIGLCSALATALWLWRCWRLNPPQRSEERCPNLAQRWKDRRDVY